MSRIWKSTQTESRLLFTRDWESVGWRVTASGDGVSFQGGKNVVLDNGAGAQVCEYTKTHGLYVVKCGFYGM